MEKLYNDLFSKHQHPNLDGTEPEAWLTLEDAYQIALSHVEPLQKENEEAKADRLHTGMLVLERDIQIDKLKLELKELTHLKELSDDAYVVLLKESEKVITGLREENRNLKISLNDVTESREEWKDLTLKAKSEIDSLKEKLKDLEK